jgi:hypothetical protein
VSSEALNREPNFVQLPNLIRAETTNEGSACGFSENDTITDEIAQRFPNGHSSKTNRFSQTTLRQWSIEGHRAAYHQRTESLLRDFPGEAVTVLNLLGSIGQRYDVLHFDSCPVSRDSNRIVVHQ